MIKRILTLAAVCVAFWAAAYAPAAHAVDSSCQLKYPIVLSHHWSASPLCADPTVTGAKACVNTQNYERFCAAKGVDSNGQRTCAEWRVPPEDADLPPRDTNRFDPTLKRALLGYHRYFSRAIVDGLAVTCGNKVYVADKPAYASYEVRAKSLRNTVLQALAETHADKVILMGLSQGAQDARFMTAALPVSDTDASKGRMKSKVAAVVTLSGEDGGAESATLQLDLIYLATGGVWTDYARAASPALIDQITQQFWTRTSNGRLQYVLGENCQGADCDLMTTGQRYTWLLRSLVELTPHYMHPTPLELASNITASWGALKSAAGMSRDSWEEQVPRWQEANNGVKYYSYGAVIQNFNPLIERPEAYYGVLLMAGPNDGFVSIGSQKFATFASNFEHIRTLNGSILGSGYHHMFFSGRNDALYEPAAAWAREPAPYQGDSASFFRQAARDLKARGL
jgi:pimeloyl-ACP methyl ester carboxylesterase